MTQQNTKIDIDFEVDCGRKVIYLPDVKPCLDHWPYGDENRIYLLLLLLSLRPSEPMQLTWDNFRNGVLYFRPNKQKKRGVLRRIRIPPGMWAELMTYKNSHFFGNNKLFPWTADSFRRRFNGEYRYYIGGRWELYRKEPVNGIISRHFIYTLSSFRTTCATLIYYFYSKVYGHGNLALCRACKFMGHSSEKMTATYYIKRIEDLGLDKFPQLPYLQLMEYVIYHEIQCRITEFTDDQTRLGEF